MGLPCRSIRALPRALAIAALCVLLTGLAAPAEAGSMPVVWMPATDGDLAGYRVHYGTAPGSYTSSIDVGGVTSATLANLSECTRYYVAIKAYDTSGNQSAAFSNEITGYPSTAITQVSPASAERGSSVTVTVSGANFAAGARVSFSNPKITVVSTTLVSCNQMRAEIAIAPDAALGAGAVDVTNTDRTFASRASALSVVDVTVPSPTATAPAAGATGVPLEVQPTVSFSEPMDPASITTSSVQLLLADGTPVAQAVGSPSLDATGRVARIVPGAGLAHGTVYSVRVVAGAAGARDATGTPLSATFTQSPGFMTIAETPPDGPTVVATTPVPGATSVPVTVQPTITFSAPMDAATISRTNVRLLLPDGTPVAHGSGSPTLDVTGKVARLMPAGLLLSTTAYRIQIVGGPGGASDAQGHPLAETYLQPLPFTTEDAGDTTPPTVISTAPLDGAMDIAVSVRPTITLSEPLDPVSVSASSVQLLRADGSGVPQAAGSPALDATGKTIQIVPAAPLTTQSTYRVRVIGGGAGVRDVAGNLLTQTYVMAPGFTTLDPVTPPSVLSTNPNDGATDASPNVNPAILFNKPLSRASVHAGTVQLLLADGSAVPQAAGSPALDASGTMARIIPASQLAIGTVYVIHVVGGSSGIKDTSGIAMTASYIQRTGFELKAPPGKVNNLHRKDRK